MSNSAAGASRRDVLCGLAAAGAVMLGGSTAWSLTPRARSDYAAILDAACGPSPDHRSQIAAIENSMGATLPDARIVELLRRTPCPACGCPLAPPIAAPGGF